MELSIEIGIDFNLNNALTSEYANFGISLSELHGNDKNELFVPAVFILDRDMKIVWSHIEKNYMTRAAPSDVLNALQKINVISYAS